MTPLEGTSPLPHLVQKYSKSICKTVRSTDFDGQSVIHCSWLSILIKLYISYQPTHLLVYLQTLSYTPALVLTGTLNGKVLVNGHGCRSLWGLSVHPTKEEFATCGDDASLRVWNSKDYSLIRTVPLEIGARAGAPLLKPYHTPVQLKSYRYRIPTPSSLALTCAAILIHCFIFHYLS